MSADRARTIGLGVDLADPGQDLRPAPNTISHTSVSLMLNCPQKFEFAKVRKIEPVTKRPSLQLGKAAHYGVEKNDPGRASAWLVANSPAPANQAEQDALDNACATVEAMVEVYLRQWPSPVGEMREFSYRVRLRNPWSGRSSHTYDLLGYADGVIEHDDYLELVERKFVGQITPVTIRKLRLDRQVSLACYGLWRQTGKPVKLVHYRYVRRPTIRQRKNETAPEFRQRLRADYRERPEHYTHGEALYRDVADLERIEAELWEWGQQMKDYRYKSFFPRNTSHCADFGGCEYLPLCTGDPDAEALFQERQAEVQTPDEETE